MEVVCSGVRAISLSSSPSFCPRRTRTKKEKKKLNVAIQVAGQRRDDMWGATKSARTGLACISCFLLLTSQYETPTMATSTPSIPHGPRPSGHDYIHTYLHRYKTGQVKSRQRALRSEAKRRIENFISTSALSVGRCRWETLLRMYGRRRILGYVTTEQNIETVTYLWRAYITTATALVGGVCRDLCYEHSRMLSNIYAQPESCRKNCRIFCQDVNKEDHR
jgi:hypothetical protein